MEQSHNLSGMLDLIIRPAFAVADGRIQYCNEAARQCTVSEGAPIDALLETGQEAYAAFTQGCLYLTLRLQEQSFGASVKRVSGFDVFILDQADHQPQLQAMALAARELRKPLSDLIIAAGQLPEENRGDPNRQMLEQGLYQMLRLVGNMSDAARYAEKTAPRQELRDVPKFVSEVFAKASTLTIDTGITLRFTNYPQSVISLLDGERLERAIYNLISNAIKFSPKDSTVEISLTRHGNYLHLTVSDSGRGIPDEILGNVFSRHLRQPGVEEGRHGIGLGMYMVRSAASAHGGTVLVQRGGEKGTRVTMTLAIRKDLKGNLSSPKFKVDYAGEFEHGLTELADVLPPEAFSIQ